MILETLQSPVNDQYFVSLVHQKDDIVAITLPGDKTSKSFSVSKYGDSIKDIIDNARSDLILKQLWPGEFKFDFDMSIDAWRDLVITERRTPFETEGLTKKEAEWAWVLINQWELNPVDSKSEFMEMLWEAPQTLEALGYHLYLDTQSQNKLLELFNVYEPLTLQFKPSMDIVRFYQSIWNPLRKN